MCFRRFGSLNLFSGKNKVLKREDENENYQSCGRENDKNLRPRG